MKMPKIKQRQNKYNAQRTIVDSIAFHSKAESNRYKILKLLENAGHIRDLKLQASMPFVYNGIRLFTYYADFTYYSDGIFVVEDVKGMRTPLYKLKKKMIEVYYGIKITEIKHSYENFK